MAYENIANSPEEWKLLTLGEICESGGGGIQTGPFGSQLHAADYATKGIPSIMPKNITVERIDTEDIACITDEDAKRLAKYLVQPGDIIYSRRGDVEKCALVTAEENGWLCGTGCLRIRLGEQSEISPEYLHAFLAHPSVREWVVRHAIGATMPNLNTSILGALTVPVPREDTQREIAAIWRTSIDKIELNRRMNRTLEAMAQAIFKSWFVDFEPVRAKAATKASGASPEAIERAAMAAIASRSIEEAVAQEGYFDDLSPSNRESLAQPAALFPDSFQPSELGEIPEGWNTDPILNEVDLLSGGTPKTSVPEYWGGDIKWASAKDVSQCGQVFLIDTERKITKQGLDKSATHVIPKFTTVVVARGATTGRLAMLSGDIAMNQTCYALRSKTGGHFYGYCHAKSFIEALVNAAHGSVFNTITTKTSESSRVVLSDHSAIGAFETVVQPIFGAILSNQKQSRTLAQLRDTLLPKLLSGELTVPEAESRTEDALT